MHARGDGRALPALEEAVLTEPDIVANRAQYLRTDARKSCSRKGLNCDIELCNQT